MFIPMPGVFLFLWICARHLICKSGRRVFQTGGGISPFGLGFMNIGRIRY